MPLHQLNSPAMNATPPDRATALGKGLRRLREEALSFVHTGGPVGALSLAMVDSLERDLLPRTLGDGGALLVGIVGPNNAGKSALFNALAGELKSPSRPTGGATRRLLGVARKEVIDRLCEDPESARFPLNLRTGAAGEIAEATLGASDPNELLLSEAEACPDSLLLVDTPDFDSIRKENRLASESLIRVADLVIVVVTRHTYQNLEVVEFLHEWLAHGRPWVLVYNESIEAATTIQHTAKLIGDVGDAPLASFHASFDIGIAGGERPLSPAALPGSTGPLGAEEGLPLLAWLSGLAEVGDLKADALRASMASLRESCRRLIMLVEADAAEARALQKRGFQVSSRFARRVAAETMPLEPFLEAFRAVLDRRPTRLQRGLRGALGSARRSLGALVDRFRGRVREPRPQEDRLRDREALVIEAGWAPFFEELSRDLTPVQGTSVQGTSVQGTPDVGTQDEGGWGELHRDLSRDLGPARLSASMVDARKELGADPEVLGEFREACEGLIEAELEASDGEWVLQLGVDAIHLLPAAAAGLVILKTGGLGADVAVGGAGALSTILAERLSRVLGSQVAQGARERWADLRSERLATGILSAALPDAGPRLEAMAGERADGARRLKSLMEEIPWSPSEVNPS